MSEEKARWTLPGHKWDTKADLGGSRASRGAAEPQESVISDGQMKGTSSEMPSRRGIERGVKLRS